MFNNTKQDASRNKDANYVALTTQQNMENSITTSTLLKATNEEANTVPVSAAEIKDEDDMEKIDAMIHKVEMEMRDRRVVHNKDKECVKFKFSVYVLGVAQLNSQTESYRCRFEVSCFTEMTKQQKLDYIADPEGYEPKDFMQVYSLNTVEMLERKEMIFHNNKKFIIYYDEDFKSLSMANIWWINAELSEGLELENFPFDVQHLQIPITFEFRDQNYMRNYKHKMMPEYCLFMFMDGVLNLNGWNMDKPHLEFKCVEYNNFPPKYAFLRFTVQREWLFYVKRVIAILAIISLLTNLTFIFGHIDETVADRFSYISTMFLSAVAYMFVITSYLPQLRYLSLLDQYTFFTFGFQFLIAVETAVAKVKQDDIGINLDDWFFWINYGFWVLIHIYFVIVSYRAFRFEQNKHSQIKEVVDAAAADRAGGGNEFPTAIFGKKIGHDKIEDFNGADVYFRTDFKTPYDDIPHVRYGYA